MRRALGLVALAIVAAGAVWGVRLLLADRGPDVAAPRTDALSVPELALVPNGEHAAVAGYAFVLDDRVLLCPSRTRTDPPACEEAAIVLDGIDPNRLDLLTGETPDGRPYAWSRDEIVVVGTKAGAVLEVEDLLPAG